jgi:GntR family histidine utilization transcriptional repressor
MPRQAPPYQQIKTYVLQSIADGVWKPGEPTLSERDLVKKFGVARMTASRALDELATQRILTRVKGMGTFVSPCLSDSTMVEISDIGDEIARRGRDHGVEVLKVGPSDDANALLEMKLSLPKDGGFVFYSQILHFEDDVPIQFEDRYVNPLLFPGYLDQDFARETPNAYLARCAPVQHGEYRIASCMPDDSLRRILLMDIGEPCLTLRRQTRVNNEVASVVTLWHPASRFQLSGWCNGAHQVKHTVTQQTDLKRGLA